MRDARVSKLLLRSLIRDARSAFLGVLFFFSVGVLYTVLGGLHRRGFVFFFLGEFSYIWSSRRARNSL